MKIWNSLHLWPKFSQTCYSTNRSRQACHARVILPILATLLIGVGSQASAQIALGTAQEFGVLGGSTVTNTGATQITGDVGVSPGTSVTGFPPGTITSGAIHAGDAPATQAQVDLAAAYTSATATACGTDLTGQNLGGLTLAPGVYCFSAGAALTGVLTLNLQGNPAAFFLFKIGSTLTTATGASVALTNADGALCAQNVYWQVGSSATFGSGSSFYGSVLAKTSITMDTSAGLSGNALAQNGAVTLDTNMVAICSVTTPVRLQAFDVE